MIKLSVFSLIFRNTILYQPKMLPQDYLCIPLPWQHHLSDYISPCDRKVMPAFTVHLLDYQMGLSIPFIISELGFGSFCGIVWGLRDIFLVSARYFSFKKKKHRKVMRLNSQVNGLHYHFKDLNARHVSLKNFFLTPKDAEFPHILSSFHKAIPQCLRKLSSLGTQTEYCHGRAEQSSASCQSPVACSCLSDLQSL